MFWSHLLIATFLIILWYNRLPLHSRDWTQVSINFINNRHSNPNQTTHSSSSGRLNTTMWEEKRWEIEDGTVANAGRIKLAGVHSGGCVFGGLGQGRRGWAMNFTCVCCVVVLVLGLVWGGSKPKQAQLVRLVHWWIKENSLDNPTGRFPIMRENSQWLIINQISNKSISW